RSRSSVVLLSALDEREGLLVGPVQLGVLSAERLGLPVQLGLGIRGNLAQLAAGGPGGLHPAHSRAGEDPACMAGASPSAGEPLGFPTPGGGRRYGHGEDHPFGGVHLATSLSFWWVIGPESGLRDRRGSCPRPASP